MRAAPSQLLVSLVRHAPVALGRDDRARVVGRLRDAATSGIVRVANSDRHGAHHGPSFADSRSRRPLSGHRRRSRDRRSSKRLRAETSKLPDGRHADRRRPRRVPRVPGAPRSARAARSRSGRSPATARSSVASALPADGRLVCCDVSDEWTSIARRYWARPGVADRIELRLASGAAKRSRAAAQARRRRQRSTSRSSTPTRPATTPTTRRCLELLRAGGLIAIDNVLWSGTVADPDGPASPTRSRCARSTAKIRDDPRVDACLREPRRRRAARARALSHRALTSG